jgi:hypothetical protein
MIHSPKECGVKLKAINKIMEQAKRTARNVEVIHMCDSVIQLSNELLGEMNSDDDIQK